MFKIYFPFMYILVTQLVVSWTSRPNLKVGFHSPVSIHIFNWSGNTENLKKKKES